MKLTKKDIVNLKELIPETLAKHGGHISKTCEALGLSRTHFYRLLNSDPEFAERCKEAKEIILDEVEGELFKAIKKGNVTAMIFYLKTQGKNRGYIENPAVNLNVAENITEVVINVKGRDNE